MTKTSKKNLKRKHTGTEDLSESSEALPAVRYSDEPLEKKVSFIFTQRKVLNILGLFIRGNGSTSKEY